MAVYVLPVTRLCHIATPISRVTTKPETGKKNSVDFSGQHEFGLSNLVARVVKYITYPIYSKV